MLGAPFLDEVSNPSFHPSTGPLLPLILLHKASFALPDANIGQAHNTRLLSDRDVLVVLPDSDIVGVNVLVDGIDEDIVSGPGLAPGGGRVVEGTSLVWGLEGLTSLL